MARTYSEKFLRELADNENLDQKLGINLAKLCVKANLPIAYVARALGVTKLTVFHWFRGREIRNNRRVAVTAFMSLVERDMESGALPAANVLSAKSYIQSMIGQEF